jgi:hypothetical protein
MLEKIMATRKKTKKASPKKKPPVKTKTYKIVHENICDTFGTIKQANKKFKSPEEYDQFLEQFRIDPDFSPQSHLSLIDKFNNTKDKKKLKFTSSELKLLEKALQNSHFYLGTKIELNYMKRQLAWANTAFKDKSNDYAKNLREAGGRLGFTKGAKKQEANSTFDFNNAPKGKKRFYDPEAVTSHYTKLTASGIERKVAVSKCVKKFSFPNSDACSRYLRKHGLKNIPNFRTVR